MAGEAETSSIENADLVRMSAEILTAYVTYNEAEPAAIPDLIHSIHRSLRSVADGAVDGADGAAATRPAEKPKPAVPVGRSVQQDHIVCLEDGKQLKMLKRYLRTRYDMSPEEYRRRWGLPADYPMVAPAYAQRRSDFAKQIGLGKGVRKR